MTELAAPPVLTFPLPASAGGGNASIGVHISPRAGHVDFVISCDRLCGTVTVPASEAEDFGRFVADVALIALHPLAKVRA